MQLWEQPRGRASGNEEDGQIALAPGYGNQIPTVDLQSLPNAVILFPAFVPLSELIKDKPGTKRTFVIAFAAPFSGTTEVAMVAAVPSGDPSTTAAVEYTLPDDTPLNLSQSIPCLDNRLVDCPRNTFTLIKSGKFLPTRVRLLTFGPITRGISLQETTLNIKEKEKLNFLTYQVTGGDMPTDDPSGYCLQMEPDSSDQVPQ